MNYSSLIIAVLILLAGAYLLGRNRARTNKRQWQSPAFSADPLRRLNGPVDGPAPLLLLLLWSLLEGPVTRQLLIAQLPEAIQTGTSTQISLALSKVYNLAAGAELAAAPELQRAVQHLQDLQQRTRLLQTGVVLVLALIGVALTWRRIRADLRARSEVEALVRRLLFASSGIAVLTTFGILASVLYESWQFFGKVNIF